jgi:4-hydroxy-L-threonine phosphate dehydrogenase PdxA
MKNKIIIVAGDPNSINSELIFKIWKKLNNSLKKKICLIGNYELIAKQFKIIQCQIKLKKIKNIDDLFDHKYLNIINIDLKFKNPFKVSKRLASKYILKSLNLAHELSLNKNITGFINCPINKNLLPNNNGVTEYLASRCNIKDNSEVMLINNKNLSVSPITTHIDINQVTNKINPLLIKNKIFTLNKYFIKLFKKKPKIAVLGLNPHNSELRKNSKEIKVIKPTIEILKKKGINLKGPLVADTIFISDYKNYDVIIGMYHDQVLAPFKSLYKFDAINITLGLKYLRVSPDHGVATDLIKKNKANATSLLKCIYFINKLKK